MENKCNEWECPYNKDGKCATEICDKLEEIYNFLFEQEPAKD